MNKYNTNNKRISIDDFQHPADKLAVDAVLKVPGVEKVLELISENSVEKLFAIINDASSLKITEEINPKIHSMIKEASEMFCSDVTPSVYLTRDYSIQLMTDGMAKPYMMFTTSLLENVDDETLWGVISSGIAAFEAKHATIKLIDKIITYASGVLPFGVSEALQLAINGWKRNREYTCDRALLLALGDFEKATKYMLLGEASDDTLDRIKLAEPENCYYNQAKEFIERKDKSAIIQKINILVSTNHPYASRYTELYNWYVSGEYDEILERSISDEL